MIDKTREVALKTLYKIDKEETYSNLALDEMIKQNKNNLDSRDIGLISEIVYGTVSWKLTIDEIIKKYSSIKMKKISPWILNILRMGIYQIIFLDKIPKSAAVNESVNLAKRYGHKGSSNFVNAILRKVNKEDIEEFYKIENSIERISKITSTPEWIVDELLKEKNEKEVEEICKSFNIKPKTSIRVNRLKITKTELKEKLKERNINCQDGKLNDFLTIDGLKDIENLDLFKEGYFTVQDESAGMASIVLNPLENEFVLDACSAPGGKTTYLAEIMNNKGKIIAWDIYEHRLNLIKQNYKRLGIDIIETNLNDATIYKEEYFEKFDKILLDVLCLGIGVIRRKPDIKWQRQKEDINEITKIQMKILETCSKYLKKGGELVYSTCSIFEEENQNIIDSFLNKNPEYKISRYENITNNVEISKYLVENKYIKIYPNNTNDGFFICKIYKKD